MKILLSVCLACVFALSGCASLQNAGTASYSVRPFVAQGETHCCEVAVINGKEIALLDATIEKHGPDYSVHLHEEGVAAFKGQQIAAGATVQLAAEAGKVAAIGALTVAAPALAPIAGAALASGGLGAAAVGAGATLGVQKLLAPATAGSTPNN